MRFGSRSRRAAVVVGMLSSSSLAAAQTPPAQAPAAAAPSSASEPSKSDVVMPKLLHFEQAPYPAQALSAGLSGVVALKLTIDREGNVTQAEVTTPAGNGFDEAARDAALKFKYEPATRGGVPIPVTILYRYSFTAPAASEQPSAAPGPGSSAASPTQPPSAPPGQLSGVLRIAGTDEPLAGTELVVTLPDGSEQRLFTDAQGRFQLAAAPEGRYRVRVATPGFHELSSEEQVASGEETDVVYRLSPQAAAFEILIEGERPAREVTRRTIERREIERIPGTGGDALRSIQSLPGVARAPGLSGLLLVRGSAPNDTQVFSDGSPLPLIYHFGGLSSVIPTELLDRIDFYPGNFSARFGRAMGGIIDVGMRSPDTSCYADYGKPSNKSGCYHGMLQLDLIDGRLLVQGPIAGSKDWSFALAGRRSWVDAWLGPILEEAGTSVTTAPVYYDYQAIVERKVGKSRLSLRGFGADDRLEILFKDPAAEDPGFGGNFEFGTAFYRLQAQYQDELSSSVDVDSMLSFGKDTLNFSLGNFLFNLDFYTVYARHEFQVRVAEGIKANLGLDFLVAPYDVTIRAPDPPREGEPSPGPFVNRPLNEEREKSTLFRPAWYGELELTPTPRLRVVPGFRVDYSRDTSRADVSPRINARFDLVPGAGADDVAAGVTRRRTTLKAGVGVYYQPPEPQETNEVFGTPDLESNRSVHYALGVEQQLTRQVELSVEGFYKDMDQLVSRAPADAGFAYGNAGLGSVIGLETLLKYKPDDRFFGWVAYTLSRSVRQDSPDEAEYLFQYDQTHNLIVLGSYRLGRGWEIGAKFRFVSGPLTTPVVSAPALQALYAADAGSYVPLQGAAFSRRLPVFHQLDVRIDKRWQFRTWRFSAYLDILNSYSNAAVEGLTYNFDYSRVGYQRGIPIIPVVGMRGEF